MESNLNRARHSNFFPPSASMPSIASRSLDQASKYSPPATNGDGQTGSLTSSKHRQFNAPFASSVGGHGHTRISSETSVPSSLHTVPGNTSYGMLGEGVIGETASVGTSHIPLDQQEREHLVSASSRSQGLVHSRSYNNRQHVSLQPLNEDGPAPSSFQYANEMHTRTNGKLLHDDPDQAASDFDSKFPVQTGLTRSRSTVQMRELRDQMQDLRGKISSLKQQAREDHLRRRSLQSLRIPSPFTAAEQWYTGIVDLNTAGFGGDAQHGWNGVRKPLDDAEENQADLTKLQNGLRSYSRPDHSEDTSQPGPKDRVQPRPDQDEVLDQDRGKMTDTNSDDQKQEDDADLMEDGMENVKDSEQGDIVGDEEYYEPSSELVSERHEDRPDAFDYQNFFLHSAMGSFSKRRNQRRGSSSSTDSAETTKPNEPILESSENARDSVPSSKEQRNGTRVPPPSWHQAHSRQNSLESVSTLNSFATATEGRQSDIEPDEDDWTQRPPMAGAWQSDTHISKATPSHRAPSRVDPPNRTPPKPPLQTPQPTTTNGHPPPSLSNSKPSSPPSASRAKPPPRTPRPRSPPPYTAWRRFGEKCPSGPRRGLCPWRCTGGPGRGSRRGGGGARGL